MANREDDLRTALNELTDKQDAAMRNGDHAMALAMDEQIMKIAAAISGDGPIVGSGGRTSEL